MRSEGEQRTKRNATQGLVLPGNAEADSRSPGEEVALSRLHSCQVAPAFLTIPKGGVLLKHVTLVKSTSFTGIWCLVGFSF